MAKIGTVTGLIGLALLVLLATPSAVADDPKVFDSGSVASGETFEWTADTVGTYTYTCTFHPQMTGTINVAEADGMTDDFDVSMVDFGFEPETLMVYVGSTVRWTNNGNAAHTATSDDDVMEDDGSMDDGDGMEDDGMMDDDKEDDGMMDDDAMGNGKNTPGPGALTALVAVFGAALVMASRKKEK